MFYVHFLYLFIFIDFIYTDFLFKKNSLPSLMKMAIFLKIGASLVAAVINFI